MLYKFSRDLSEKIVKVEKLEVSLREEQELSKTCKELAKEKRDKEKLQTKIYLSNKPLPKLPNKFKLFREKIKTGFHQLVARIEVKTK